MMRELESTGRESEECVCLCLRMVFDCMMILCMSVCLAVNPAVAVSCYCSSCSSCFKLIVDQIAESIRYFTPEPGIEMTMMMRLSQSLKKLNAFS